MSENIYYSKYCLVPLCQSTSRRCPDKPFLTLPKDGIRRDLWLQAIGRSTKDISEKTTGYLCADHFNLKEDMRSYIKYKLMGGRIYLKHHVIPHIFDCQKGEKREFSRDHTGSVTRSCRKHSNFRTDTIINFPGNQNLKKVMSPRTHVKLKKNVRSEEKGMMIKPKIMSSLYQYKELLKKDILRKRILLKQELQCEIQNEIEEELAARIKLEIIEQDEIQTGTINFNAEAQLTTTLAQSPASRYGKGHKVGIYSAK